MHTVHVNMKAHISRQQFVLADVLDVRHEQHNTIVISASKASVTMQYMQDQVSYRFVRCPDTKQPAL